MWKGGSTMRRGEDGQDVREGQDCRRRVHNDRAGWASCPSWRDPSEIDPEVEESLAASAAVAPDLIFDGMFLAVRIFVGHACGNDAARIGSVG